MDSIGLKRGALKSVFKEYCRVKKAIDARDQSEYEIAVQTMIARVNQIPKA